MDISTKGVGKYVTTVQIPISLRKQIKESGMSINGALIAGWGAIQERKEVNQELAETRANLDRYRRGFIRLQGMMEDKEQ